MQYCAKMSSSLLSRKQNMIRNKEAGLNEETENMADAPEVVDGIKSEGPYQEMDVIKLDHGNDLITKNQTEKEILKIASKLEKLLKENADERHRKIYKAKVNTVRKVFAKWQKLILAERQFSTIKCFRGGVTNGQEIFQKI